MNISSGRSWLLRLLQSLASGCQQTLAPHPGEGRCARCLYFLFCFGGDPLPPPHSSSCPLYRGPVWSPSSPDAEGTQQAALRPEQRPPGHSRVRVECEGWVCPGQRLFETSLVTKTPHFPFLHSQSPALRLLACLISLAAGPGNPDARFWAWPWIAHSVTLGKLLALSGPQCPSL